MFGIIAVNCAGMNARQKTKIRKAVSVSPQIELHFSDYPAYQKKYDLLVISQKLIQNADNQYLEQADYSAVPVIVYGRGASFSIAAASSCSDAVHEDCTGSELLYRIMKQSRRNYIRIAGRKIMIHAKHISCGHRHISISSRDKKLLQIFSSFQSGTVLSREYLCAGLGIPYSKQSRVIDMSISNLRKKIAHTVSNTEPENVIQAVPGEGYFIE